MWAVSDAFKAAIRAPVHTIAIRVEVLDTDFNTVAGGVIEPSTNVIDGAVDVDITRANRRTFQMNLLNNESQFSLDPDLAGLFYVDRLVRVWRGVEYGPGAQELVPIGTFMLDKADVTVERNMSIVTLSGQDLWKKLSKSQFTVPTVYEAGTPLNTVITDMAQDAGITQIALDPLVDRATNSKTLNVARAYEVGDKRGEELVKLCEAFGLDVFFNPMGVLVTEDFRDPADTATVWTYQPGEAELMIQLQKSTSDEHLFNHVVVVGTGDETQSFRAERKDEDPLSPTSIQRIGDRVKRLESGVLATQEAVDAAVLTMFYNNRVVTESIRVEAMCMPAFEGNDVVRIREARYTGTDERYRLKSFSVPLSTSKQILHMERAIKLT